jgi:hypothetical protein
VTGIEPALSAWENVGGHAQRVDACLPGCPPVPLRTPADPHLLHADRTSASCLMAEAATGEDVPVIGAQLAPGAHLHPLSVKR